MDNRFRYKDLVIAMLPVAACVSAGCEGPLNDPYPANATRAPTYFATFLAPPKHLDPARAYSSDEYRFMAQVYEPPFDYHYLKRPYRLVPLTATAIPKPVRYDRAGRALPEGAASAEVHRVVYRVRIREGITYQNHPCFARAADGSPHYAELKPSEVAHVDDLKDLPRTGTRELLAKDYVTQICRLADPRLGCPIYSTMKEYIVGLDAYRESVNDRLEKIRAERKAEAGITYDRARDEQRRPIRIDYGSIRFDGATVVDDHTYTIALKREYPQMLCWLAMPFFAPMPQEAVDFYAQPALVARGITLDRYPVGTGPYRFETYVPNLEVVLRRNENFHDDFYPTEADPGDVDAGLLVDAGKTIPFIDRIVFKLEKEALPRWNKFLQGYFDQSRIAEDSFDQAIQFGDSTGPTLTPSMLDRGVHLATSVQPTIFYCGFNMLDPVVGGYTPKRQKLRQAIAIAIDNEEWIDIFFNGRGIPPHGPIPPGIFGAVDGTNGHNPFLYDPDPETGIPARKNLKQARRLLAEAGYPDGRDATGKPLTISFDNHWESPALQSRLRWMEKKVEQLGVRLDIRTTDYSTFRDKVKNANFQLLFWGWHADYPDPENFLFLLYGPNGKKESGGENACNYDNPEVNRLFRNMEVMANGPERLEIIQQLVHVIQRDSPWVYVTHPVEYTLTHDWVRNDKPNTMTYNTLKFIRLDPEQRARRQREWNRPAYWPLVLVAVVGAAVAVPAMRVIRRPR